MHFVRFLSFMSLNAFLHIQFLKKDNIIETVMLKEIINFHFSAFKLCSDSTKSQEDKISINNSTS